MQYLMPRFERTLFTCLLASMLILFSVLTSALASQHAGIMVNLGANGVRICVTGSENSGAPLQKTIDAHCAAMCALASASSGMLDAPDAPAQIYTAMPRISDRLTHELHATDPSLESRNHPARAPPIA